MQERPPKASIANQLAPFLQGQVIGTQPLRVQTIPMVHAILQNIGFSGVVNGHCGDDGDVAVDKVVEALVHSRLQNSTPVPLYQMEEWFSKTILPNVLEVPSHKLNDVRLGRVLELLDPAAKAMWVQLVLRVHSVYGFDLSLAIYDTSSVYVEGEYEGSELLRFGYSRDGKSNCKQFNLGLNVTGADGMPLLYHVTPGNVEDSSTVPTNLQELQKLYRLLGVPQALSVLGDRAMLTPEYVHLYERAKVNFIGSMRACALNTEVLKSVSEAELLQHPMSYLALRNQDKPADKQAAERYWAVRTQVTVPASKEVEGSSDLKLPVLVVLGAGKRRLDQQHRETLLTKTEHRLLEIAGYLNKGKYLNRVYAEGQIKKALSKYPAIKGMLAHELVGDQGSLVLTWSRVVSKIEQTAALDGRYAVYFRDEQLADEKVFTEFKSRDKVEKRVDDIKGAGPVVVRPVFLHKEERIRGLVFVCMVALLVMAIEEMQVRRNLKQSVTGNKIQGVFQDFGASLQTFKDRSQLVMMPTPNKWQRQLLTSLGIQLESIAPVVVTTQWTQLADATDDRGCPWAYQPDLDTNIRSETPPDPSG